MKAIIHWNTFKKMWTCHTYKGCAQSPIILISGDWYAETKPLKKDNPKGWIVTNYKNVIINPSLTMLASYTKTTQLYYNKQKIEFSILKGNLLLFDEYGCFIIIEKLDQKNY